jgi:hypothetical protein
MSPQWYIGWGRIGFGRNGLGRIGLACVLFVATAATSVLAGDFSTGGTFLQLGHGARAHGLGGGGVALMRTDDAVYWNPANLAWLQKKNSVTFMQASILPGVDDGYSTLSAGRGFGERLGLESQEWRPTRGAYGLFLSHMGFQFDSGKKWSENILKLSTALAVNNYTSVGVGLKLLQANNDFESANGYGYGIDLAFSLHLTERLRAAVVGRDLWTRIEWDTGTHEIVNRSFVAGVEYSRWHTAIIADWVIRRQASERFILGAELDLLEEKLVVRGALTALSPGEARAWPSAGVGISLAGLTFDYGASFDEADALDVGHRASLRLQF